jgi:excinuclease UvrABC helicase subunit UvrB
MLRRRFNFNDLFSEFDSLFDGFGSYNNPMVVRGKKDVDSGEDENGAWTKETFTSEDGTYQVTSIYRYGDITPKKDSSEVSVLKDKMNKAVESQDYETAAQLRDKINSIESNKEKIQELQSQLDDAVSKQDFEKAIKLRDKIKKYNS